MGKIKLALCSGDTVYCERLAAYIMNHRTQDVELYLYSDAELLQQSGENFDCIIVSEEMEHYFTDQMLLILSDTYPECMAEEPAWETGVIPQRRVVSRYQTAEQLLHEVFVQTGQRGRSEKKIAAGQKLEVVGVCSPSRHEMQTLFSVLYAENMANERKVLYLSILEFLDFEALFGRNGENDIGDFILAIRNHRLKGDNLWQFIYMLSHMDYIAPFANPENIGQIGKNEITSVINFIEEYTEYDMLVIDFSLWLKEICECLNLCDLLYVISREEYFYQNFDQAFDCWLEKKGQTELIEKIQRIHIPHTARNIRNDGNLIEQLQWSDFGDYVRQYTQREKA